MHDGNLTSGGSLGALSTSQLPINVGNLSSTQYGNTAATINFLFAGNVSEENRVQLASNVVTNNANSFIGNTLWNYDTSAAPRARSVTSNVHIVYGDLNPVSIPGGSVRPLSLNSSLADVNLNYEVSFPTFTGKTNAQSVPDATHIGFFANIYGNGSIAGNANESSTGDSNWNLSQNEAVDALMLNGVAYSEFNFSNYSHKFTDVGNVCGLNSSNYKYNAINYSRGNAELSNNAVFTATDDAFLNTLVDYNFFNNLSGSNSDVHRLTISDIQYRYYVGRIVSQVGVLDNRPKIEGSEAAIASDLFVNNTVTSAVKGNLEAPNFVSFVYENVNENSTSDVFYPFYNVSDSTSLTNGNMGAHDTH
jgi:hypothetical protein